MTTANPDERFNYALARVILTVLEEHCSSYCLDNADERSKTAIAVAIKLRKAGWVKK